MKGLILSGGYGWLRPITYSQQKQLIPTANKPILFYAIGDVVGAGIRDIGVGANKEQVMETANNVKFDVGISFIEQDAPRGLAHAVLISEEFIGDDPFVMYLGDNILKEGISKHAEDFRKGNFDASIMLTEVDNPGEFGVAELSEDGNDKRLVEKPKKPPLNLTLVGFYFFNHHTYDAVKNIKVTASVVSGWWKDTGKPDDILHANRLILDDLTSETKAPALIGRNCVIKDSYIGFYTSIGNNCKIINAERDVIIEKNNKLPKGNKFIIGDNALVRI